MATIVVIAGDTATGKSTSYCQISKPYITIKGLDPNETFLFNIAKKPVPMKGGQELYPLMPIAIDNNKKYQIAGKGRRLDGHDYAAIITIIRALKGSSVTKYVIVDDFQYLMSLDFFERRNEQGFDKYGKIGFSVIDLVEELSFLPDHMIVFLLAHTDTEITGEAISTKLKTIGKMLDEKFSLTGLFAIVLNSVKKFNKREKQLEYKFITKPQGEGDIAKTPIGMFEDENQMPLEEIPNDLGLVAEAINAYRKIN